MSVSAVFFRVLNILVMLGVPLLAAGLFERKNQVGWRLFGVGAVTFVLSQVLHIPFNVFGLSAFFLNMGWGASGAGQGGVWVALLLGLSAGVFEEVARYGVFRFWLKKELSWERSVMLGLGHGGVEALILGGVVLIAFVQAVVLNEGNLAGMVSGEELALARAQLEAYWSAPWYLAILGGVERAAALAFHLSASVLVWQVFRRGSLGWLGAAIGWHALLDAAAVGVSQVWGPLAAEGVIVGFGMVSLGMVWVFREKREKGQVLAKEEWKVPALERVQEALTEEDLEDSHYA